MNKLRRKPRKALTLPTVKEKEGTITGLNIIFGNKTDEDSSENTECQRAEAHDQIIIHDGKVGNETTLKESEDKDDTNSTSTHGLWYQDEKRQTNEVESDDRKTQEEFGLDNVPNVNNNNNGDGNGTEEKDQHGSSDAFENNGNLTGFGSRDHEHAH